MFFTHYRPLVRLLKRKGNMYCIVSISLISMLILLGCNAGKKTGQNATSASTKQIQEKAAKQVAQEETKVKKAGCGTGLFDKMDESMYKGDPATYGDVILSELSVQNGVDPVVFSHKTHRAMYTCRVCHLELEFSMKKGDTGITREDYLDGRYCGACHDGKAAFPVNTKADCNRCHIPVDAEGQYKSKDFSLAVRAESKLDYGDGVNWVEMLQSGKISPKTSLSNEENPSTMPLPGNLQNERLRWTTKTAKFPVSVSVWFPHEVHVQWLDCANCHPDIFMVEKDGTVEFNKEHIIEGKYCGACHLNVAFPMDGCRRCHPNNRKKKLQ